MLKEENFEEESKESSVQFSSATYLLEEKELKKKEERNKENTEESLESVPMSPLDPNWGERIPLHTHVGALGGCCDRPVCSSAEEDEEKPNRGSPQPTMASLVAGDKGQTPPPIGVADNSD